MGVLSSDPFPDDFDSGRWERILDLEDVKEELILSELVYLYNQSFRSSRGDLKLNEIP